MRSRRRANGREKFAACTRDSYTGISAVDILAISADESLFGASRIAQQDYNFFGLHAPVKPHRGQTGTDPGPPGSTDGAVAVFSHASGYHDSGAAFTSIESGAAGVSNNPTAFAAYLHAMVTAFRCGYDKL